MHRWHYGTSRMDHQAESGNEELGGLQPSCPRADPLSQRGRQHAFHRGPVDPGLLERDPISQHPADTSAAFPALPAILPKGAPLIESREEISGLIMQTLDS